MLTLARNVYGIVSGIHHKSNVVLHQPGPLQRLREDEVGPIGLDISEHRWWLVDTAVEGFLSFC